MVEDAALAHVLGGLGCTLDGEILPEGEWVELGTAAIGREGLEGAPTLPCLTWLKLTR